MKWIFIPTFITNDDIDLIEKHADLMTGFTENIHPNWMENGIRSCKKLCKEINNSKYKLKKLEKELNDFYKTNYKIKELKPSETGYYWDYINETYTFPQ